MYKSLKRFGERLKEVIKSNLTTVQPSNKSKQFEPVHTIQSIDEFNEKLKNSNLPVIVNFSAAWCFNCKILNPLIESIVRENSGKIMMFKVDVDEHTDLALEYKVSSIPILFGIHRGQIKSSLSGLREIEDIRIWVEVFLKKT